MIDQYRVLVLCLVMISYSWLAKEPIFSLGLEEREIFLIAHLQEELPLVSLSLLIVE